MKQSRIEKWFINRIMYEMEHPGFPNPILGLFAIYYLMKWNGFFSSKLKGDSK